MNFNSLIGNTLVIQRASVFKWYDYAFSGGTTKDKYWITLNCKINDFPISVVLPTSKSGKAYYTNASSLVDTVFIKANDSMHFPVDTIIDLKNIFQEEESEIVEAYELGYLVYCGELEAHIMEKVESTIRNSQYIEPYLISEYLCEE